MGTIQKQGIQNTIITYLGVLIGFVNLILIQPNFLKVDEVGLIRVLISFSSLLAVLVPLGITNITVRYFPAFRNNETGHSGFLGFIVLFPLVGGAIIYVLLTVFKSYIISKYVQNSGLFITYFNYVLPLTIVLGFISVLNQYCFSLFKSTVPSLLNDVVNRLLTIVVILIYFLKWVSLDVFIFLFFSVYVIQFLFLFYYLFKIDKPSLRIKKEFGDRKKLIPMLRYGFLLSFASLASLGIIQLDSVMIGSYMPLAFAGIYSIAAYISTVIETPLNSLERIAGTKLSDAITHNRQNEIREIYYKSSKYLFLLGSAIFLMVNLNIADLLSFLPKDYRQGVNVVYIISVGSVINMAGGSNSSIIFSTKYYRLGGIILIGIALMAFGLNILLIPRFGLEGAAYAKAITAITFTLTRFIIIKKGFNLQPYDKTSLKILFVLLTGILLSHILPVTGLPILNMAYRSVIVSGVFAGMVYYLNIIPEFHHFIPFLRKKNL